MNSKIIPGVDFLFQLSLTFFLFIKSEIISFNNSERITSILFKYFVKLWFEFLSFHFEVIYMCFSDF